MEQQAMKVLHDLKLGKAITPQEALRNYGTFRLASRIHELREMGWPIVTDRIQSPDNPKLRYASYYLERDQSKWPSK